MTDLSLLTETLRQSGASADKALAGVLDAGMKPPPDPDTEAAASDLVGRLVAAARAAETRPGQLVPPPGRRDAIEKAVRALLRRLSLPAGAGLDHLVDRVLAALYPDEPRREKGDPLPDAKTAGPAVTLSHGRSRGDVQSVTATLARGVERQSIDRRYREACAALELRDIQRESAQRRAAEARDARVCEEAKGLAEAAKLVAEGRVSIARRRAKALTAARTVRPAGSIGTIHFARSPLPPELQ